MTVTTPQPYITGKLLIRKPIQFHDCDNTPTIHHRKATDKEASSMTVTTPQPYITGKY